MRSTSSTFSEAHFDAKAGRYQAALRACPLARALEVLPFAILLNDALGGAADRPGVLADLLCGGGFLTGHLQQCFREVVGIDVSSQMLKHYPLSPRIRRIKAEIESQSELLRTTVHPTVVASLAGVHHVYVVEDGRIDEAASGQLQASVLCDWARALPPDGCLIVADVTAPDQSPEFSLDTAPLRQHVSTFEEMFADLSGRLGRWLRLPGPLPRGYPRSIAAYVGSIGEMAPCVAHANPAQWFRKVVAPHGLYGHNDHFLIPSQLVAALAAQGHDVRYHELPTPWVFPTKRDFEFFFYEKFALGPPVEHVDDITTEVRQLLNQGAQEHLGLSIGSDGHVVVGWRLGYYVVRAPHRP